MSTANRQNQKQFRTNRRGAAVVEFALVASVMFLLVMGSFEFGRAMMSVHGLREGARSGCRAAILKGTTIAEIQEAVNQVLSSSNISGYTVTVEPAAYAAENRWAPITVIVSVPFGNVSWLPIPRHFNGRTISASVTLPKEYAGGA